MLDSFESSLPQSPLGEAIFHIILIVILACFLTGTAFAQQPKGPAINRDSQYQLLKIRDAEQQLYGKMQALQQQYTELQNQLKSLGQAEAKLSADALKAAGLDSAKYRVIQNPAYNPTDAASDPFIVQAIPPPAKAKQK